MRGKQKMETQTKQWFDDITSPDAQNHLKNWARHGLPLQAKNHKITEKRSQFEVCKVMTIVRK
jgi:hypothetical protein